MVNWRRSGWIACSLALMGCIGVGNDVVPSFDTEPGGEGDGTTGAGTTEMPTTGITETDDGSGSSPSTTEPGTETTDTPGTDTGDESTSTGEDCVEEICDGRDNDCDDEIDEDCDCVVGDQQSCYTGDAGTEGVGACVAGTQTCEADGWGACEDEVVPTAETCNNEDDDCDNEVDEDFGQETCGQGICEVTLDTCVDGKEVTCVPGDADPTETCDGFDNTCDGNTDEGCNCIDGMMQPCYTGPMDTVGVGLCDYGTQTCVDGDWGACTGDVVPATETCDGQDENCDGTDDDGDPGGGGACDTGLMGVCAAGTETCQAGDIECVQDVPSSAEICDGEDNNCNGTSDEGNPESGAACNTGLLGVCAAGTENCVSGDIECTQNVPSSAEVCDNLDNNCDGTTDEGNPGGGAACSTGLPGQCAAGTQTCVSGFVVCLPDTPAEMEICDDGIDNDCNGVVDNGCAPTCVFAAVQDDDFEGGSPSLFWAESSLQFGTPLCTVAGCGTGGGSGPFSGIWWAWFGGFAGYEIGSVTQSITIPAGTQATLSFYLEMPVCDAGNSDSLVVSLDGITVTSFDNSDPRCGLIGYQLVAVDISAFADGLAHTLDFTGEVFGPGVTNFFVEDISIESCS